MAERILIVRLGAIGDVAITSALLARIRAELPDAHVTWLCGARVAPLVALFEPDDMLAIDDRVVRGPLLRRVSVILGTWAALWRRGRFDRALLVHADRRYMALLPPGVARTRRMLSHSPSARPNPIPGRYLGDEYARLLDPQQDGRGPVPRRYEVLDVRARLPGVSQHSATERSGDERPVVLVPGGARNLLREQVLKRWPAERYSELAGVLRAQGHRVALVGDAADAWVRPLFANVDVDDWIGQLSLSETMALMRDSAVVVSHDTGPLHLSRLVRAPFVALFGPTIPEQILGATNAGIVLWGGADLACRPCYDGIEFAACANNLCMQDISVRRVMHAVEAMTGRAADAVISG